MSNPKFNRREFLKISWLAAVSLFLKACANIGINIPNNPTETTQIDIDHTPVPPDPTKKPENASPTQPAEPTPTTNLERSIPERNAAVALVKTNDRAGGVRQAIDLLDINPVKGKTVFLKPNFNSSDPAPGSTHPDVLRTLIQQLQQMGAAKITLGDRSGMGNTTRIMQKLGVLDLAEELGVEVIVFDELDAENWELISPEKSHWSQGIPFVRPALEADVIIQACCVKTHQYGGNFTMSLKNSVGLVAKTVPGNPHNFMTELHSSPAQRKMIAEINQLYQPGLILMDGVISFTTGGPASGKVAASNIILAGTDRIALDAVGVAVLRKFGTTRAVSQGTVFEQEQIARAVELGIGIDSPEKISFLTGNDESELYAQELKNILLA